MGKFVLSILSIFIAIEALAVEVLTYESSAPAGELRLLKSISGIVNVSSYISGTPENENSFKQGETYLRIEDGSSAWWLHTPSPYDAIDFLEAIDDSNLLITLHSAAATATAVLNLQTKELYPIGTGIGKIISTGPNKGLLLLEGQYAFDKDGRFWFSSVTDLRGRVVEIVSKGSSCLPISEILSSDADISMLRQPMSYCAGIDR